VGVEWKGRGGRGVKKGNLGVTDTWRDSLIFKTVTYWVQQKVFIRDQYIVFFSIMYIFLPKSHEL